MFSFSNKWKLIYFMLTFFIATVASGAGRSAFSGDALPLLRVVPGQVSGGVLPVEVVIEGLPEDQDVLGFDLVLSFNPAVLQYQSLTRGSFFNNILLWPEAEIDNTGGTFKTSLARSLGSPPGASGSILTITFTVAGEGTSPLIMSVVKVRDPLNQDIPFVKQETQVSIGSYLTRGGLARILVEALGLNPILPQQPTFSDVPLDHWAAGYIYATIEAGIFRGFPDVTFRPEGNVTRAELAAVLSKAFEIAQYYTPGATYTDVLSSHWAFGFIEGLTKMGIISGYPDGSFLPEQLVISNEAIVTVQAIQAMLPTSRVSLSGAAMRQGQVNQGNVTVALIGTGSLTGTSYRTVTPGSGGFRFLELTPGIYTLVVTYHGYLVSGKEVTVETETKTEAGNLFLLAGDMDGDNRVGLTDLKLIAQSHGKSATSTSWDQAQVADFNGDGLVDVFDMVLLAKNFGKSGYVFP